MYGWIHTYMYIRIYIRLNSQWDRCADHNRARRVGHSCTHTHTHTHTYNYEYIFTYIYVYAYTWKIDEIGVLSTAVADESAASCSSVSYASWVLQVCVCCSACCRACCSACCRVWCRLSCSVRCHVVRASWLAAPATALAAPLASTAGLSHGTRKYCRTESRDST